MKANIANVSLYYVQKMLICITYKPYIYKKHNCLHTVIKKNQGIEINAKCKYLHDFSKIYREGKKQ